MNKYMTEKWNLRYMKLAYEISKWSKDPSKQIGAVLIGLKGQVISQGYNSFPRKIKDTEERYNNREIKYKYIIHAELNCIYNAIYNNSDIENTVLYVYGLPVCHECAKAIIQTGIKYVFMCYPENNTWTESGDLALSMFDEVGIQYTKINYNLIK